MMVLQSEKVGLAHLVGNDCLTTEFSSMISHYMVWNGLDDVGNHKIGMRQCVTWKLQTKVRH